MFFIVALSVYFGGFAYLGWRINSGFGLKPPYNWYLFFSLIGLGLITILAFVASRYGMPFASIIGNIGFIVMGALGICATLFIINDIVNIPNLFFKIKSFRYYSTLITLSIAFLFCVWSVINTAFFLRVKEITIPMPGLKVDSLRVIVLSDIHITAYTSKKKIIELVDKINSLNPDLIALAGDLVDTDISKNYAEYGLDRLQSKYGVFAVTGNHEYYAGLKAFFDACRQMDFHVLRNENFTVTVEGESIITVSGINDPQGQSRGYNEETDINKAFEGIEPGYPVLFLSHRPELFDEAAAGAASRGFNIVQFSGHIHDGQIPPVELVVAFFKYNYGLYKNGDSYMYLTSGTRWWGPPMRLFNMSEIAVVTLVKSEK